MSKRSAEELLDEPRKRVQVAVASVASVAPASVVPGVSRWSFAEIPDSLPPLPPINPDLEKQVFRHPGLGGPNWERLEWYGDATLEMLSTEFIFETFPHLPSGRCSQIREQLVRNVTLAQYYREYGMEHKTQLPADLGKMPDLLRTKMNLKNSTLLVKIQGDVFEAYVGAVVKSGPQGTENAVAWLKILWGRTIKDQIKQAERHREAVAQTEPTTTQEQSTQPEAKVIPLTWENAKTRLSVAIAVPGIKIQYKDMPCKKRDKDTGAQLHAVGVYLDGWGETNKHLGFGVAVGKPEAGGRAALQALENRKLMQVYTAKKKQWTEEKAGARKADSDS